MTKSSLLKLQILDIMSKEGVKQREDFSVRLNVDIATIDRVLRDLVEYEIINYIRGCGYVITEDTTAFNVLMIVEDTAVMVEDNTYKIEDNLLTTMLRGYSKLHEELKTVTFKATTIKQILEYEGRKYKKREKKLTLF